MNRATVVVLQHGDTLQAIAARELGNWTRWRELAELNGLRWPYLNTFASPGDEESPSALLGEGTALRAGDRLRLPLQNGLSDPLFPLLPLLPFGTDLSEDGPALPLVRGLANLRAALQRRLRTALGYLPHHPEYGSCLRSFIGQPLTLALVLDVRSEIQRALSLDPRVLSVKNVAADVRDDALSASASCETDLGELALLERIHRLS